MTRRKFDSFAISVVRKGWKLGFEVLKLRKFFFKTKETRLILNYLKFTGIKDFSCSKTAIHSRPQNPSINSVKNMPIDGLRSWTGICLGNRTQPTLLQFYGLRIHLSTAYRKYFHQNEYFEALILRKGPVGFNFGYTHVRTLSLMHLDLL